MKKYQPSSSNYWRVSKWQWVNLQPSPLPGHQRIRIPRTSFCGGLVNEKIPRHLAARANFLSSVWRFSREKVINYNNL